MILERKAPAKVNLGLHVLRKRADGYHDLETVFLAVGWYDYLKAAPVPKAEALITFTCTNESLPVNEDNLCVQAAQALVEVSDAKRSSLQPVHLHLEKHLPFGAGLGGGSSDAANTLRLLNQFWGLNVDRSVLHNIAAGLGSDIAFFLEDTPMYATGRGEVLQSLIDPVSNNPYVFPFELVLVVPPIHVATALAYQDVKPNEQDRVDLCKLLYNSDLGQWKRLLENDFERSVFAAYPTIGEIKQELYDLRAGYAAMSGSGSAVFGVFENAGHAKEAASQFKQRDLAVWCSASSLE